MKKLSKSVVTPQQHNEIIAHRLEELIPAWTTNPENPENPIDPIETRDLCRAIEHVSNCLHILLPDDEEQLKRITLMGSAYQIAFKKLAEEKLQQNT